jgi:hypothetical protein
VKEKAVNFLQGFLNSGAGCGVSSAVVVLFSTLKGIKVLFLSKVERTHAPSC